jgi:hypothetical protein
MSRCRGQLRDRAQADTARAPFSLQPLDRGWQAIGSAPSLAEMDGVPELSESERRGGAAFEHAYWWLLCSAPLPVPAGGFIQIWVT